MTIPQPTRAAALARLQQFIGHVPVYAARRGFVTLGNETVSSLSPYLRRRVITEREVVESVLRCHSFPVAEKFIQEVVWRTYWKGWLERNPAVWTSCLTAESLYLAEVTSAAWGEMYLRACKGTTHLSFFNDWVQELTTTGYLHNHVRMWFASVWIFTFKIPWELGAMYMYRNLLDGDPASNTLSWRWVAGIQTKGKSYQVRAENVAKFSEGRWQPKPGELAEQAYCVIDNASNTSSSCSAPFVSGSAKHGAALHKQLDLNSATKNRSLPLCDKPFGVLTTAEDLSIDQVAEVVDKAVAVVLFHSVWLHDESMLVRDFVCDCEHDAINRLQSLRGIGVHNETTDVVKWAHTHSLSRVLIVAPSVGPHREQAFQAASALIKEGIEVIWYKRQWDAQLHGLADKGFFPFWERVKKRIERGEF